MKITITKDNITRSAEMSDKIEQSLKTLHGFGPEDVAHVICDALLNGEFEVDGTSEPELLQE